MPLTYLPTLTGRIIGSSRDSDAFLWDYRRTIAEMLADNHYKIAADILAKQKIGLYAEAMGISLPTTGDGLLNKGQVTIPMGEFWTPIAGVADTPAREADVLEATSAGHVYGKEHHRNRVLYVHAFYSRMGTNAVLSKTACGPKLRARRKSHCFSHL